MTESVNYTKLDGTTVSADMEESSTVFDTWLLERVLMSSNATLADKKLAYTLKSLDKDAGVKAHTVADNDDTVFKVFWAKFLADPNVSVTNTL